MECPGDLSARSFCAERLAHDRTNTTTARPRILKSAAAVRRPRPNGQPVLARELDHPVLDTEFNHIYTTTVAGILSATAFSDTASPDVIPSTDANVYAPVAYS